MREQTIGEILREARVAKHLTLEDVEEKAAIPSPHLLALELEQFKLIPKDKVETYLQQYGEAVELDTADLLEKYHEQEVGSSDEEQEEHVVESTTNIESIVKTPQDETISIAKSVSDDSIIIGSRSSRYKGKEKTNSYLPIVMLCLVALGILAFVSFVTWNYKVIARMQVQATPLFIVVVQQRQTQHPQKVLLQQVSHHLLRKILL